MNTRVGIRKLQMAALRPVVPTPLLIRRFAYLSIPSRRRIAQLLLAALQEPPPSLSTQSPVRGRRKGLFVEADQFAVANPVPIVSVEVVDQK